MFIFNETLSNRQPLPAATLRVGHTSICHIISFSLRALRLNKISMAIVL